MEILPCPRDLLAQELFGVGIVREGGVIDVSLATDTQGQGQKQAQEQA